MRMKPCVSSGFMTMLPATRRDGPAFFNGAARVTGAVALWLALPITQSIGAIREAASAVSNPDAGVEIVNLPRPLEAVRAALDPDVILPPAWAFGVLHGYYTNQAGILRNMKRLEAGHFPVDAIWVDSAFWDITTKGPKGYIDFKGDRQAFPDLRRLTRELELRHVRFGIWIWDRVLDANPEVFQEFASKGFFKPGQIISNGWHNVELSSVGRTVDFSNPAAAALWAAKLRPFLDQGVDFFKIDADPVTDYVRTHFELSQKYGRHTRGRGFILSQCNRGSLVDIKRYPAAWTGDAQASWHQPDYPNTRSWVLGGLRQQIEMVANPTWRHSAYPFLANDTGGFHARSLQGAEAEELYIRWVQFSAFGSLMQIFGAPSVPEQNAPFAWPERAQENFRRHAQLRLRLFPYIYTHALLTRLYGRKMIQGEQAHRFQYLFGDSFLVAPVCEPGATNRLVWLPPGDRWMDYWTGLSYAGGQQVTIAAPIEYLPLLVRAGAIIPMRDYAPSVLRGHNATLTLDVFPDGAIGPSQFTLYEDDGISNDYRTNAFATTRITCEPARDGQMIKFCISPMQGYYDGKLKRRCWKLQMHTAAKPSSVSLNGRPATWHYQPDSRILEMTWKAATAQASEVTIRL